MIPLLGHIAQSTPDNGATAALGVTVLVGLVLLGVVFYRRQRSRRELQARARELAELGEITKAVASAPLDPEEIAEVAYLEAARLLETDFFQLGLFEADRYRIVIWVRHGSRQPNRVFELGSQAPGIVAWVRREMKPVLVRDFEAEREILPATPSYESPDPPRSGMFVPLMVGDHAIGLIAIQSRQRKAFDDRHLRLLTIIANTVASALALVNLQASLEFRTLQLVLIRDISRRLVSLQPLPDLFSQVVTLMAQALDYPCVRLFECNGGSVALRASSLEAVPEALAGSDSLDLVHRAMEEGRTVFRMAQEQAPDGTAHLGSAGISQMAVPLKVEDRVLGVLDVYSEAEAAFPDEQVALAETVAAHLALAVLEARNFASQQEEAWITTVLLEVARHAARPGDVQEALQAVLQLTTLLAGATWAALLLPDDTAGALRLGPASGLRRPLLDQLADVELASDELGLLPPFEGEAPLRVSLPPALAQPLDTREVTAVTLSDGTSLLGVLLLEGQELVGRRLSLLVGIAHQISLRLENTRLIEVVAARRSVERELAMARSIQESFLPSQPPEHPQWEVGATWRVAHDVGGDFYDFIPLGAGPNGPRWGIVIADVADKGIPAALFMALCRTLLRSVAISRIDPGQTLTRVNDLIFADSKAELFVSVFYALWEPEAGYISFANGGHNPPLLFVPDAPPCRLTEHGMVLGVCEDLQYATQTLTFPPGGLLVLYTDGVTGVADTQGQLFGLHRLEHLVLGMSSWGAQSVADEISQRVSDFCSEPDLPDDLTAVVLRRRS
ncbi:MAG: GAF domain-containing SpoIIE family protein phosphatase [Chloroflexota bacterium]